MTEVNSTAGLSRLQKKELLRKILAETISRPRMEPASYAQERLWFLDRLEPVRLTRRRWSASWARIVRRHEALRTTFAEVDGAPVQVVAPFGGFTVPVEDLAGLGEADREAAVGGAPTRRQPGRSTSSQGRSSARRCCG